MGAYKRLLVCLFACVFIVCKECQAAVSNVCGDNEKWPCDNSECILRDHWCDSKVHCEDGTDEKYCKQQGWWGPVPDNNCDEKHFVCEDGRCIPAVGRCDGLEDCSDESDEDGCERTPSGSSGSSVTQEPETEYNAAISEPFSRSLSTTTMRSASTTTRRPTSTTTIRSTSTTTTTTMRPTSTTTIRSITSAAPTSRHSAVITSADYYNNRKINESIRPNQQIYRNHYDRNSRNRYGQTQIRQPNYPTRNGQRSHTNNYDQTRSGQDNFYNQRRRNSGQDTEPSPYFAGYGYSSTTPYYSQPYSRESAGLPSPDVSRSVYDPSGPNGYSYVPRQRPMTLPPRRVLYPPNPRELYYSHKKAQKVKLPRFYFASNYTQQTAYNYERNVEKAKQWLIDQRDSSYAWGQDTPRALVALSLITNSFTSDVADNDLMKKGLQAHLGIKLLRNRTEPLSVPRLAMYINALHATCQNPRDFLGHDLVQILVDKIRASRDRVINPYVYLTLCLSSKALLTREDIQSLITLLDSGHNDEIAKDQRSLAITALACVLQQYGEADTERYEVSRYVNGGINRLLNQTNGNFGNVYSTAIAAQAIMSTNLTSWNPTASLDYLARRQYEDGSFGDMLSTYYSLPALSGRSLIHLRNTQCDPIASVDETLSPRDILNLPGPRKSVFLSIKVGYPETISFSMQVSVPENTNLIDTMKVAEYLDPLFGFKHITFDNSIDVYEVTNIPNDAERGLYWNLYVLRPEDSTVDFRRSFNGNIKTLIPRHSQEIVYWYLPTV